MISNFLPIYNFIRDHATGASASQNGIGSYTKVVHTRTICVIRFTKRYTYILNTAVATDNSNCTICLCVERISEERYR